MTDDDLDTRLAALLSEAAPPADARFANRIVSLAAYDLSLRRSRRRVFERVAQEAAALGAALSAFALLARLPADALAGFGDAMPIASPAMLGVALLALWGIVSARDWTAA
jgi:hypothetical protein